jgi:hypothetical protein
LYLEFYYEKNAISLLPSKKKKDELINIIERGGIQGRNGDARNG